MGIQYSTKTKLTASLKLFNHINSFLLEQEFDELKNFSPSQVDTIKKAAKTLSKVINNG